MLRSFKKDWNMYLKLSNTYKFLETSETNSLTSKNKKNKALLFIWEHDRENNFKIE
jgi:hypothetical protein